MCAFALFCMLLCVHCISPTLPTTQAGGGNGNGGGGGGGGGLVAEQGQFLQLTGGGRKEPLLPTPPTAQMVKLDTTLTCQ